MYLDDLLDIFNQIAENASYIKPAPAVQPKGFGRCCPSIQRVTFNGDTTVVFFVDGTYCVMKCSASDNYDRKTAIVYAIAKRMFGKIGKTGKDGRIHEKEIDGDGFGAYLQKIVDSGFDQQLEEKNSLEKKRKAKEDHVARQKVEHDAAFERRVNARAEQILFERAAIDRANALEDAMRNSNTCSCACGKSKKILNETTSNAIDIWKSYKRPNKPFSQFTTAEKREYWKAYNAKRRASKKS